MLWKGYCKFMSGNWIKLVFKTQSAWSVISLLKAFVDNVMSFYALSFFPCLPKNILNFNFVITGVALSIVFICVVMSNVCANKIHCLSVS